MKKQGDIRRSEEDARTSRARGWTSLSVNPWGALQHSDTAGFVYPGAQGVGFCVPGLVTYGWGPPPGGRRGEQMRSHLQARRLLSTKQPHREGHQLSLLCFSFVLAGGSVSQVLFWAFSSPSVLKT